MLAKYAEFGEDLFRLGILTKIIEELNHLDVRFKNDLNE